MAPAPKRLSAEEQAHARAQMQEQAQARQASKPEYEFDVEPISQYAFDGGEGSKFVKLYVNLPQLPQLASSMVRSSFTHSSATMWVDCAPAKRTFLLSLPDLLYEIDADASKVQVKAEKKQVVVKLRKRADDAARAWVSATKA